MDLLSYGLDWISEIFSGYLSTANTDCQPWEVQLLSRKPAKSKGEKDRGLSVPMSQDQEDELFELNKCGGRIQDVIRSTEQTVDTMKEAHVKIKRKKEAAEAKLEKAKLEKAEKRKR